MSNARNLDPHIVDWLAGISASMEATLRREAPNLYLQHTQSVDTKKLDSAVCSHLEWRDRLEDLFATDSMDRLSGDLVARDDLCALGHWIHGEGSRRLADLPAFMNLKRTHADFHRLVGSVVAAAQRGERQHARAVLGSPAYLETSWQVVNAIADLSKALGKSPEEHGSV
jgi:hypothetical protein